MSKTNGKGEKSFLAMNPKREVLDKKNLNPDIKPTNDKKPQGQGLGIRSRKNNRFSRR